jgi:hypothetical protein
MVETMRTIRATATMWILLTVGLLSGCLGAPDVSIDGTAGQACPVTFPDGTPFDCHVSQALTEPLSQTRLDATDGWKCTSRWQHDNGRTTVELYHHLDGRLATYWHFPNPAPGVSLIGLTYLVPSGDGQAWAQTYQETAWFEWPEVPNAEPAEVHVGMRSFMVDIESNGTWIPASNISVLMADFQSHPYYVVAFDGPNGREYIDAMSHEKRSGLLEEYIAEKRLVHREGYNVFLTVGTIGVRFSNFSSDPLVYRSSTCVEMIREGAL